MHVLVSNPSWGILFQHFYRFNAIAIILVLQLNIIEKILFHNMYLVFIYSDNTIIVIRFKSFITVKI